MNAQQMPTAAGGQDGEGEESSLGGVVVEPGSAVKSALNDISSAQTLLTQQTWGTGNVAAGLAATLTQGLLDEAAWSLTTWQNSIESVKSSVAETVGIPLVHQLSQLSLIGTLLLPTLAQAALGGAAATVPLVGLFGAPDTATQVAQLIAQAQPNSLVYGVVPFVVYGENEIIYLSVNGGPRIPVEIDSGSSGLVTTRQYVGTLGSPTSGPKNGGYGNDVNSVRYNYNNYAATINFGGGIVTGQSTVNIVTPETQQAFNNYQYGDGIVGVLGIGANTGTGPNPMVNLPGELKDGVLEFRFGSLPFGVMILGPNPLPARVTVADPGSPYTYTVVRVNGGPPTRTWTIIDSGGIYGDIPASVVGTGQTEGSLPAGTTISVYSPDGATLLYSYVTTAVNTPTVTGNTLNTGIEPYRQFPMYTNYAPRGGLGSTSFDIF